jgi:phosphoglycolate phosphatase-like HAD superfamily hydrolase
MKQVAGRFGDIVRDKVIASPLVPGVADFFETHQGAVPMVVASATPTAELRHIIAARGISHWFDEVEGSPALKGEIVARFLEERRVDPERAVMVGDQFSDQDAARFAGVRFVAYRPPGEDRLFDASVVVVDHFDALPGAIVRAMAGAET